MEQQRPRRRGGGGVHVPLFPYPLSAALWLLLLAVIVGPRAAGGFEAAEVEVREFMQQHEVSPTSRPLPPPTNHQLGAGDSLWRCAAH